jgi:hypothetical protein
MFPLHYAAGTPEVPSKGDVERIIIFCDGASRTEDHHEHEIWKVNVGTSPQERHGIMVMVWAVTGRTVPKSQLLRRSSATRTPPYRRTKAS